MLRTIDQAREYVAVLAEKEGENKFAREVRAGCWDHRGDVQKALSEDFKPRVLRCVSVGGAHPSQE